MQSEAMRMILQDLNPTASLIPAILHEGITHTSERSRCSCEISAVMSSGYSQEWAILSISCACFDQNAANHTKFSV